MGETDTGELTTSKTELISDNAGREEVIRVVERTTTQQYVQTSDLVELCEVESIGGGSKGIHGPNGRTYNLYSCSRLRIQPYGEVLENGLTGFFLFGFVEFASSRFMILPPDLAVQCVLGLDSELILLIQSLAKTMATNTSVYKKIVMRSPIKL